MFNGIINMIIQILTSYKYLIWSIQLRHFAYLYCHITTWTLVLSLLPEIDLLAPLSLILLKNQFQKPQNQFKNLILTILFL